MHAKPKKTLSLWPISIVVFFLFLFSLDGMFFYLATSTSSGLITEHPYEEGLKYEDTISLLKQSKKLGWKLETTYSPLVNDTLREIHVKLSTKTGEAISGAKVNIGMLRPSNSKLDTSAFLNETSKGLYSANIPLKLTGLWLVQIHVTKGENQFLYKSKLLL